MDLVLDIVSRVMVWLGDVTFGLLSVFSPTVVRASCPFYDVRDARTTLTQSFRLFLRDS